MKAILSLLIATSFLGVSVAWGQGAGARSGTAAQTSDPDTTDIMGGGTPGGEQHPNIEFHDKKKKRKALELNAPERGQLNSQQRMEEKSNNIGIIPESDKPTESDGRDYRRSRNKAEEKTRSKHRKP